MKKTKQLLKMGIVLAFASILFVGSVPLEAQRRGGGSFGGGGRSFGSGGTRSFGGGSSFGGGRSYGSGGTRSTAPSYSGGRSGSGSFGPRSSSPGSSNFSRSGSTNSTSSRSGPSSFGRSGSFGGSGHVRSTSIAPSYYNQRPTRTTSVYYGGGYVPAYSYGFWSGYSLGWAMGSPPWYYWTPFHPSFYFSPPVYYNGGLYPGGFSWFRFFIGLAVVIFAIWLLVKIFSWKKGVKYTVIR